MLKDAVAAFLSNLGTEREFDAPFVALLRSHGFFDVHCIHGTYEFGKDFVAKRNENGCAVQYAIQTKHGSLNNRDWMGVRDQCETMAHTTIGHPSVDSQLARKDLVVITGEFTGQAAISAQEYLRRRKERHLHSIEFWTRENLVDLLSADSCLLAYTDLVSLSGRIDSMHKGDSFLEEVEILTSRWTSNVTTPNLWRSVLEAHLVRDMLRRRGLRLHAAQIVLGLARVLAFATSGLTEDREEVSASDTDMLSKVLTRTVSEDATEILSLFKNWPPDMRQRIVFGAEPLAVLTCGARLLLMMELIGLAVLSSDESNEFCRNDSVVEFFQFCMGLGCTMRPLSDRYAVSVLLSSLAASKLGVEVEPWLRRIVIWICDRHDEGGLGLSSSRASVEDELWRTMGDMVDRPDVERRRESTLAAAVLDACSLLGYRSLYEDAMNDFMAVDLIPYRIAPDSTPGEYMVGRGGCVHAFVGDYSEEWLGEDGWKNSAIHRRIDKPRPFDASGNHFVGACLSSLLRDRWWMHSLWKIVHAG